jgi:hypothetical protein
MKAIVGTDLCMHAHVGFLARGQVHIQYADGCTVEFAAPQVVVIEPGHDGWVFGDEAVVLIEFDFEGETVSKLGMPDAHRLGDGTGFRGKRGVAADLRKAGTRACREPTLLRNPRFVRPVFRLLILRSRSPAIAFHNRQCRVLRKAWINVGQPAPEEN